MKKKINRHPHQIRIKNKIRFLFTMQKKLILKPPIDKLKLLGDFNLNIPVLDVDSSEVNVPPLIKKTESKE
jgi:hypothetical protein